jgi:hypothetical protein
MTESRRWPRSPAAPVARACGTKLLMLPVTDVVPAGRPVTMCPACGREPVGGDTILPPRSSRADS